MTVAEVAAHIEAAAPLETAAEWDNVGLQVGDASAQVDRILVTLDITAAVVAEATEVSAGLIVSHHPLILDPLRSVLTDDIAGGLVQRLLAGRVSLYVAHTNLDAAPEVGTSAALAGVVGLADLTPLIEAEGVCCGGIGRVDPPMSLGEFAEKVRAALDSSRLTVVGDVDRSVGTVALMPGSGGDAVRPASAAGADALVCGDLKHHDALDALALGLAVVDAGHYATERPVVDTLAEYLRRRCGSSVDVLVSQVVTDPFAALAEQQ